MTTIGKYLKNPPLVTIGLSESISGIGNWITMMAVFAIIVFKGEGSITQSSGIYLAGLMPTLLFSPIAGILVDRFDRKLLMIASELLSGLSVCIIIFTDNLLVIYLAIALQAIFISIMMPARQAVLPQIVARNELSQANAFLQQLASLIKIFAPILAGAILAFVNPHTAIILDVISFLFSALILSRLPALPPIKEEQNRLSHTVVVKDKSFLSVFKEVPDLRPLIMTIFLGIVIIIGFDVLSPIFTRDVLRSNESYFGLTVGIVGIGTMAASLKIMLQKNQRNLWLDIAMGIVLLAVIPTSLAISTTFHFVETGRVVVMIGCLIGGFGNGLLIIQSNTLIQTISPARLLGRIGGIFQSTAVAGQLFGIILIPFIVPAYISMAVFFGSYRRAVYFCWQFT